MDQYLTIKFVQSIEVLICKFSNTQIECFAFYVFLKHRSAGETIIDCIIYKIQKNRFFLLKAN
jgi:hypothetical protein